MLKVLILWIQFLLTKKIEKLKIGQRIQVWARYNQKIPTKFTNVVAFESMSKYRFPTSQDLKTAILQRKLIEEMILTLAGQSQRLSYTRTFFKCTCETIAEIVQQVQGSFLQFISQPHFTKHFFHYNGNLQIMKFVLQTVDIKY